MVPNLAASQNHPRGQKKCTDFEIPNRILNHWFLGRAWKSVCTASNSDDSGAGGSGAALQWASTQEPALKSMPGHQSPRSSWPGNVWATFAYLRPVALGPT